MNFSPYSWSTPYDFSQDNTMEELFQRSKHLVPGGVHSPVRSFKGLPIPPRFVQKADGAYIVDEDGRNYIDFCMSFGPMILGHRNFSVEEALHETLGRGWSYGAAEKYSLQLAEFLLPQLPSCAEKIRFMNSGTEAVMTAVRLSRGHTQKEKILKFDGCYHGHLDSLLIKAGSGLAGGSSTTGTSEASSAGVTRMMANQTLIVDLDDEEALEQCFKEHGNELAAVILEPLPANNGLMPQRPAYLKKMADLCKKYGTVLIFDEVISGFRGTIGGMAAELEKEVGILPDLITYGKVIGGGLPVGAVCGRSEIMNKLAPIGPVYQAGTLSANPLAMAAGLATLSQLTPEAYGHLHSNTLRVVELFEKFFATHEEGKFSHMKVIHKNHLFWFVTKENIIQAKQIPNTLMEDFIPLFMELLSRGIYLAPNAYEVGFVSLAHDENLCRELAHRLGV